MDALKFADFFKFQFWTRNFGQEKVCFYDDPIEAFIIKHTVNHMESVCMQRCLSYCSRIILLECARPILFELASGRRSRPSRVMDRAWYHSNRLDELIHLQPLNCLVMDVRWGKTKVKVENSSKKRFWPSKNRKPELLISQSYGVWPWLSTDGPSFDSASTEHEKT